MLHVTDVLKLAGMIGEGPWFTQAAMDRGTGTHLATEYFDKGVLDWGTITDRVMLCRTQQYQRFIEEVHPSIEGIEVEVGHTVAGYCGKVDRIIYINGRKGVLDIKPASEAPWHQIQLAGYAHCFADPMKRWNLYLHEDRYRLVERTDRSDRGVWKAALRIAQWRIDHGYADRPHRD